MTDLIINLCYSFAPFSGKSQDVPVNIIQFPHTTRFTKQQCCLYYNHETSYLQNMSKYLGLASWYKNTPVPLNNTSIYYQQHTEPPRNHLTAPDYSPKQNFATSPKTNFDNVNCSDCQAKSVLYKTNFRPRVGHYTAQVHNLVSRFLCHGFEAKHGTGW